MKTQIGEQTAKKVVERFTAPAKPSSTKYEELEAYAIKEDLIAFGIESLELAVPKAEEFERRVKALQEFGVIVPVAQANEKRTKLVEEVIPGLIDRLEKGPR